MVSRALLQRFGGVPGLVGEGVLPSGTQLFHGTRARRYTHDYLAGAGPSPIHFEHPPVPDAPAWFASSILFSMHAGVRTFPPGASGPMMLYRYRVRSAISLLRFDDVDDLSAYLADQEGVVAPPLASNDVAAALRLHRLGTRMDGYRLDADPVRGEPEVVLFESGLRKLESDPHLLNVTAQPPLNLPAMGPTAHHRITTAETGLHMGDYLHTGGPGTFVGP